MGLSSNAGPSSHSTAFSSRQLCPPDPEMRDTQRTTTSAGIPNSRDSERIALPPGGASGGNASYDRRGLSTGGSVGASASSGFATGLYSRDSKRNAALPLGDAGASTPVVAGGGGGSRTRRGLVRGNIGVAEEANVNFRPSMEDRYVVCNLGGGGAFLGVFDGHGGAGAADFAAEVIQHNFANELKRAERKSSVDVVEILINTYHETDSQIAMAGVSRSSGCTAVTAYLHVDSQGKKLLHVANAGDSRAVLCRDIMKNESASNNIVALTRDHKPSDPQEQARIKAAGGDVIRGRVMGMLAVSRALGDHSLKDFVVSTPEVRSTELYTGEGFLLLACDGVFDVFSTEEAVSLVQGSYRERMLAQAKSLGVRTLSLEQRENFDLNISTLLARDLVEGAIQKGSRDNITCLVCLV